MHCYTDALHNIGLAMKVMQNDVLVELTLLKHRLFYLQMIECAMKTRTREHSSTLQNVHGKRASLQNVHFHREFVCKTMFIGPISLPWIIWQLQADITGGQPISLTIKVHGTIFGTTSKYITSIPQNATTSQYLTLLGDFKFIRHTSIPNRYAQ